MEKKFEELFKDKDSILSTNIELSLYNLLETCGFKKEDILASKYDKQIGKAKENIYKHFNKRLKNV